MLAYFYYLLEDPFLSCLIILLVVVAPSSSSSSSSSYFLLNNNLFFFFSLLFFFFSAPCFPASHCCLPHESYLHLHPAYIDSSYPQRPARQGELAASVTMLLILGTIAIAVLATIIILYRHKKVPKLQWLNFFSNKYISLSDDRHLEQAHNDHLMPLKVPNRPGKLQCYDPATAEYLGEVEAMNATRVNELVASARVAQTEWCQTSFETRRHFLRTLMRAIIDYQNEIARVSY